MAESRLRTFEKYSRPRAGWAVLNHTRSVGILIVLSLAFFALVALTAGSPERILRAHSEEEAFYKIISFYWLVIPGGVVSIVAAGLIAWGVCGFARHSLGGGRSLLRWRPHLRAIADVLQLKNLRGGGGGCNFVNDAPSITRRYLHHLVFYGFGGMVLATSAAAFEQDLLGMNPPYPIGSVPVILGMVGGLMTATGCAGFLMVGVWRPVASRSAEVRNIDRVFTVTLFLSVVTGLLTLALRSTELMGPMLILHLGVLGGLYVTFPYSKFVHWAYRYVALVHSHNQSEHQESAVLSRRKTQNDIAFEEVTS